MDTPGYQDPIAFQQYAQNVKVPTGIRRKKMSNKHVIVNVIKTGYKLVSVDDKYFTTLNLLGDEK